LAIQDNGTFLGDYVHGGKLSDDSFYRVWVRDQEYAEGRLDSGLPARDDGYLRKAGFRFDKELNSDLDIYVAGGFSTRRVEHVLDLSNRLLHDPSKFVSDISSLVSNPAIQANPLLYPAIQQFNSQLSLPSVVPPIPLSVSQQLGGTLALSPDLIALNVGLNAFLLPSITYDLPSVSSYPATVWGSKSNGTVNYPALNSISLLSGMNAGRFERYGEMTNDSAHIVSKINGITDFDMEWSLTGSLDHTDIYMGHLGYEWEQTQYNISFDANFPLSDRHRISYGVATQHTDLDVKSEILDIFQFPGETLRPILDYDQSFTKFN
jgi:hypothetical protein